MDGSISKISLNASSKYHDNIEMEQLNFTDDLYDSDQDENVSSKSHSIVSNPTVSRDKEGVSHHSSVIMEPQQYVSFRDFQSPGDVMLVVVVVLK